MNHTHIQQIRYEITQLSGYRVETLRALALLASEIRAIDDKATRRELTRLFEDQHGRKVAVWARIQDRFGDALETIHSADGLLALSYMCQLPSDKCAELYAAHKDHLDEPMVHLLVLRDVDDARPHRQREHSCNPRSLYRLIQMWRERGDRATLTCADELQVALDAARSER